MSWSRGMSSDRLIASKSCTARVRVPSMSNTQWRAALSFISSPRGSLPILTDSGQAFLGDRGDQLALTVEDAAAGEAAGIACPGAVHGVEQPVVHAQVAVEPQRMVETGDLHEFLEHRDAMGLHRGGQQVEVAGVGQQQLVQLRLVR